MEMSKRIFTIFVCVSFALFCTSFSVFAEESTYFEFTDMFLYGLSTLSSDGSIIAQQERNISGVKTSVGFEFQNLIDGAYVENEPGDYVVGYFEFSGSFEADREVGYDYDYVRIDFPIALNLESGFDLDAFFGSAFQDNVYLDLFSGDYIARFRSYSISILGNTRFEISFYGDCDMGFDFEYLDSVGGALSLPLSYLDKFQSEFPDTLDVMPGGFELYYIPTESGGSGSGDSGSGDSGSGDSGSGDSGSTTIIVSKIEDLEVILQDVKSNQNTIISEIHILNDLIEDQNQLIEKLPDNIADSVANEDLGNVKYPDLHEDEVSQIQDIEDELYLFSDEKYEYIGQSVDKLNLSLNNHIGNTGTAHGLFFTRLFDIPFITDLVYISLGFGLVAFILKLGRKLV